MKELFIKILRFLMFVLVVALGCIGYNIYEDTLAAVWIPVGVGLVVAVVTLPLYKKWIWLTTMEQKAVNILCHVVCVGVISCSLFLVGNYRMAAPASTATYNKARKGKPKVLTLQKGGFGLPVITKGL